MTYQQTIAILMALAPAVPDSFEHAPRPERPSIHPYLRDLDEEAGRYEYLEGHEPWSLRMEADAQAAWFRNEGGREPMNAASAIEGGMKAVLAAHPDTDKEALKKIGEQLIEALERFAADYREFLEKDEEWQRERKMTWRSQWAYSIETASRA